MDTAIIVQDVMDAIAAVLIHVLDMIAIICGVVIVILAYLDAYLDVIYVLVVAIHVMIYIVGANFLLLVVVEAVELEMDYIAQILFNYLKSIHYYMHSIY